MLSFLFLCQIRSNNPRIIPIPSDNNPGLFDLTQHKALTYNVLQKYSQPAIPEDPLYTILYLRRQISDVIVDSPGMTDAK